MKDDILNVIKGEISDEIKNLKNHISILQNELTELKEPLHSTKRKREDEEEVDAEHKKRRKIQQNIL